MTKVKCVCLNCGKIFKAVSSKVERKKPRFCSNECNKNFKNIDIICRNCGKVFTVLKSEVLNNNRKYCSTSCGHDSKRKHKDKKLCLYCKKEFRVNHSNKRYCSISCRVKDNNKEYKCIVCGTPFLATPSEVKLNRHKYCSKGCYLKDRVNIIVSEETRQKISISHMGEKNPNYRKHPSEETREKMSFNNSGEKNPLYGKKHSENTRKKISEALIGKLSGEKNPQWRGGISFGKYCPKFNEQTRERIRNKFGRKCFLCGKNEIENKNKKLDVHHINFSKSQGCFGEQWNLIALCHRCHSLTIAHKFEMFVLLTNYWAMNDKITLFSLGEIYYGKCFSG
jgi:hypothetical protein